MDCILGLYRFLHDDRHLDHRFLMFDPKPPLDADPRIEIEGSSPTLANFFVDNTRDK